MAQWAYTGIADGAHQIALKILQENQELLAALAKVLLEKEILEGEQLRSQLNLAQKTVEIDQWLQTGKLSKDNLLSASIVNNGKIKAQ